MGAQTAFPRPFLDVLYSDLLERGVQHFLPSVRLNAVGAADSHTPVVQYEKTADGLRLDWLGVRYALASPRPLSANERKLLKSVSRVLSARYRFLIDRELASKALESVSRRSRGSLRIRLPRSAAYTRRRFAAEYSPTAWRTPSKCFASAR